MHWLCESILAPHISCVHTPRTIMVQSQQSTGIKEVEQLNAQLITLFP